jgi:hypothetical protein
MSGELGRRLGTNLIQEPRELGTDLIGWTPASLSSLVAWWDPFAAYITLNGSDVSGWVTRAHNGSGPYNLVQATAGKQPLYSTSDSNLNNLPSVIFTAANVDQLTVDALAATGVFDEPNAHTIAIVARRAAAGVLHHFFGAGDNASGSFRYELSYDASDDYALYHSTAAGGAESLPTTRADGVGRYAIIHSMSGGGTNYTVRVNGTQIASATYVAAKHPSGLDWAAFGNRRFFGVAAGNSGWDGSIAHIVVCSTQLSGGDLTSLETWMRSQANA